MYDYCNKESGFVDHMPCTMTDPIMVPVKLVLWIAGYLVQN